MEGTREWNETGVAPGENEVCYGRTRRQSVKREHVKICVKTRLGTHENAQTQSNYKDYWIKSGKPWENSGDAVDSWQRSLLSETDSLDFRGALRRRETLHDTFKSTLVRARWPTVWRMVTGAMAHRWPTLGTSLTNDQRSDKV